MSDKFREAIQLFDNMEKQASQVKGKRTLNGEQSVIFKDVMHNYPKGGLAFLHGQGGSGKSVLINAIKKYCDSHSISCVVTASTGKAASALGGKTIHSYIGLSMAENNNAETADDAFKLRSSEKDVDIPQILIIDEASMIGGKLLKEILKVPFEYILFVGDTSQLRPVKDIAVDWDKLVRYSYRLLQNMRAQDEDIVRVFNHFREYKEGSRLNINIKDYVNGKNIIEMDYVDTEPIPKGSDSCFIGYRNKLVEKFATRLKSKSNTMFNLNIGITVTKMVVDKDDYDINKYGGYKREFVSEVAYYNGEDVEIIHLTDVTKKLVDNGYTRYGKWNLKLSKKGIIVTNTEGKIEKGASESREAKYWISFPPSDVLEYTTLSIINGDTFALVWDGIESEFKEMTDFYFGELSPYLQKIQAVTKYYSKDKSGAKIGLLDEETRDALRDFDKKKFMAWYDLHDDTRKRKKGWAALYSAKSVVSARPSIARTVTKAQGLSVNCVILCEDSFYGADKSAQYVAVSRAKHGIIVLNNVPTDWKVKVDG